LSPEDNHELHLWRKWLGWLGTDLTSEILRFQPSQNSRIWDYIWPTIVIQNSQQRQLKVASRNVIFIIINIQLRSFQCMHFYKCGKNVKNLLFKVLHLKVQINKCSLVPTLCTKQSNSYLRCLSENEDHILPFFGFLLDYLS
jgi:hypothetical protein